MLKYNLCMMNCVFFIGWLLVGWLVVVLRHIQRYFSYIVTGQLSSFQILNCCWAPNAMGSYGSLACGAYPDTGTGTSEDVFNLLAIRGSTHGEGMPGIETGSSDPQSSPLPLRPRGGLFFIGKFGVLLSSTNKAKQAKPKFPLHQLTNIQFPLQDVARGFKITNPWQFAYGSIPGTCPAPPCTLSSGPPQCEVDVSLMPASSDGLRECPKIYQISLSDHISATKHILFLILIWLDSFLLLSQQTRVGYY